MNTFLVFIAVLLLIGLVALAVVSLMGAYYFTVFSFNHDSVGEVRAHEFKNWEVNMMKAAAVLTWVSIGINIVYGAWLAGNQSRRLNMS